MDGEPVAGARGIDIHICGICRGEFNDIDSFIVHKRSGCTNTKGDGPQLETTNIDTTSAIVVSAPEAQEKQDNLQCADTISVVHNVDVTESSNLPREPPQTSTVDTSGLDLTCTQTDQQTIQLQQDGHEQSVQTTMEVIIPQSSIVTVIPQTTAMENIVPQIVTHDANGAPLSPSKITGVTWTPRTSRKFNCDFEGCSFTTQYQRDLERHKRVHTGERPFSCLLCRKTFTRNDKLKIHMRAHTGSKPYKCSQCDYAAADSSSLRKHLRIHTGERPFKCQICPYASRNSSQLIVHLRTHTGDAPFQCQICSARFKINSDLKRHMRMHTGEKPYKCDFCDYRCSIKGNLKSHMKINHNNANEFKCDYCGQCVPSRKILRNHRKMHGPPKPLECPIDGCIYQCHNRAALKNHMRIHSNEKPFKCEYCDYTSRQKGNVYTHIKKKHPEKYRIKKPIEREGVQVISISQEEEEHMQQQQLQQQQQPVIQTNIDNTINTMTMSPPVQQQQQMQPRSNSGKGKQQKIKALCKKCYKCEICDAEFVRDDSLRSHMRQHRDQAKTMSLEKTLESTALAVLQLSYPLPNALINAAVAEVIGTTASTTNTIQHQPIRSSESQQVRVAPMHHHHQPQHMQNNTGSPTPHGLIQNTQHRPHVMAQPNQNAQTSYSPMTNSTSVHSTAHHLPVTSHYNSGLQTHIPTMQNLGHIQQPTVVRAQDAHALLGFVQNNHNMSAEQNLQNSLVSTMATSTIPSHGSYSLTNHQTYHLTQSPSGVTLSQTIRGLQPHQQLQTVSQPQLGGNLLGRQDLSRDLLGGSGLGQMSHHNLQTGIPHPGYPRGIQLSHVQGNSSEDRM